MKCFIMLAKYTVFPSIKHIRRHGQRTLAGFDSPPRLWHFETKIRVTAALRCQKGNKMEDQKVTCKNCKHYSTSIHDTPCIECVCDDTPHAKFELKSEKKEKKVRTDETDLSKMTITLTEIENPDKGRGCKVEVSGEASVRSMAKMLHTMFCALAEKETNAFFAALSKFIESELEN